MAIEELANKERYLYILPYAPSRLIQEWEEFDPLWFDADGLKILNDSAARNWITKTVYDGGSTIPSFPEWFENGFYYRAHDWALDGDEDYKVVHKYYKKYEKAYAV
jgi:hypothetical protein